MAKKVVDKIKTAEEVWKEKVAKLNDLISAEKQDHGALNKMIHEVRIAHDALYYENQRKQNEDIRAAADAKLEEFWVANEKQVNALEAGFNDFLNHVQKMKIVLDLDITVQLASSEAYYADDYVEADPKINLTVSAFCGDKALKGKDLDTVEDYVYEAFGHGNNTSFGICGEIFRFDPVLMKKKIAFIKIRKEVLDKAHKAGIKPQVFQHYLEDKQDAKVKAAKAKPKAKAKKK